MASAEWGMQLGEVHVREDRVRIYGGGQYGGIEPSARTPNVFVYSDAEAGSTYGYNFDGWTDDGAVFLYTGEGRLGDQTLTDGNLALLTHSEAGRAVRLFIADGIAPGTTSKKLHRYVGEFYVDPGMPYFSEDAPDRTGAMRQVLVFRLLPVEAEAPRQAGYSPIADPASEVAAVQVRVEALAVQLFDVAGTEAGQAERVEAQMVARLTEYLENDGNTVTRWKLKIPGERGALFTDHYWVEEQELFEAKPSADRQAVRMAVAQLLDYRRHIPVQDLRLTVFVPGYPSQDVVDFALSCGIGFLVETEDGSYERVVGTT